MNDPLPTADEVQMAYMLGGANITGTCIEQAIHEIRAAPATHASPVRLNEVSTVAAIHKQQIKIVKQSDLRVNCGCHAELLRNLNYMRAQIGRLDKMARDMSALLTEAGQKTK